MDNKRVMFSVWDDEGFDTIVTGKLLNSSMTDNSTEIRASASVTPSAAFSAAFNGVVGTWPPVDRRERVVSLSATFTDPIRHFPTTSLSLSFAALDAMYRENLALREVMAKLLAGAARDIPPDTAGMLDLANKVIAAKKETFLDTTVTLCGADMTTRNRPDKGIEGDYTVYVQVMGDDGEKLALAPLTGAKMRMVLYKPDEESATADTAEDFRYDER